jgi:hypothetical protein
MGATRFHGSSIRCATGESGRDPSWPPAARSRGRSARRSPSPRASRPPMPFTRPGRARCVMAPGLPPSGSHVALAPHASSERGGTRRRSGRAARSGQREPRAGCGRGGEAVGERAWGGVAGRPGEHGGSGRDPEGTTQLPQRAELPEALPMSAGVTEFMTACWIAGMGIAKPIPARTSGATICPEASCGWAIRRSRPCPPPATNARRR